MTLYHFGNCVALVYVPYYLTYKYSGLSEYGAFWKCIQAGGIYIFTQLIKMLALATFFPTTDNVELEGFNAFGEFLKYSIDLADLLGILLVLKGIPGKGHTKVLMAGIGWAGAEVLLTRFLLLWVGARGAEFDWKYIQKSLESNISLVQHITTATLVWLWSRHDLRRGLLPVVSGILLLTIYRPLLLDLLASVLLAGPWLTLFVKAATTILMGTTTLHIYAGLAYSIDDDLFTFQYIHMLGQQQQISFGGPVSEVKRVLKNKEILVLTENKDVDESFESPSDLCLFDKNVSVSPKSSKFNTTSTCKDKTENISTTASSTSVKEVGKNKSDLLQELGITRDCSQVENRYKTRLKRKKTAVEHNAKSGNALEEVPFEGELSEIAANDDSIELEVLCSAKRIKFLEEPPKKNPSSKRKSMQELAEELHNRKEDAKERRHQEKLRSITVILQKKNAE